MADRAFVDTNILVYAIEFADSESDKSALARSLLGEIDVFLSTQVLGAFYSAVTGARRASPLSHDEAVAWVQFWKRFKIESISGAHVDLAIEIAGRYGIKYYDALILSTARFADCGTVYSEDLNAGQDYGGIRVRNPFVAS